MLLCSFGLVVLITSAVLNGYYFGIYVSVYGSLLFRLFRLLLWVWVTCVSFFCDFVVDMLIVMLVLTASCLGYLFVFSFWFLYLAFGFCSFCIVCLCVWDCMLGLIMCFGLRLVVGLSVG